MRIVRWLGCPTRPPICTDFSGAYDIIHGLLASGLLCVRSGAPLVERWLFSYVEREDRGLGCGRSACAAMWCDESCSYEVYERSSRQGRNGKNLLKENSGQAWWSDSTVMQWCTPAFVGKNTGKVDTDKEWCQWASKSVRLMSCIFLMTWWTVTGRAGTLPIVLAKSNPLRNINDRRYLKGGRTPEMGREENERDKQTKWSYKPLSQRDRRTSNDREMFVREGWNIARAEQFFVDYETFYQFGRRYQPLET